MLEARIAMLEKENKDLQAAELVARQKYQSLNEGRNQIVQLATEVYDKTELKNKEFQELLLKANDEKAEMQRKITDQEQALEKYSQMHYETYIAQYN